MDGTPPTEDGLLATVTQMFQRLRDLAATRFELFLVEMKEQRARMFESLLLAVAGLVCALMALILITLTVLVVFWDTHRLLVLAVLTAAYAVAAAVAFIKLRSRLQRWQAYSATLEEFKKDCACFKKPN
jgi:uncharacterized membrane protein YqjE